MGKLAQQIQSYYNEAVESGQLTELFQKAIIDISFLENQVMFKDAEIEQLIAQNERLRIMLKTLGE